METDKSQNFAGVESSEKEEILAKRSLPVIMLFAFLALYPAAASAMTVYMHNDESIEAESAWRSNGKVFIKIDRDALIDFAEDEVDLARTFDRKNSAVKGKAKTVKVASGGEVRSTPKKPQDNAGHSASASQNVASSKTKGRLQDENILVSLPEGYKVDFQDRQGNMLITEMVPMGESVHNWTEIITLQVILGGVQQRTPEAFSKGLSALWTRSCQGAEIQHIRKGAENGYPFTFWMQSCPRNPMTGKPENVFLKAIQGNDSFYVVQKAWKYSPSEEEVVDWTRFMSKVRVCDSRIEGRECP
jgi:hypothetical protein